MWAAGIILLSILCQKFPLLNPSDDCEALMELCGMFGIPELDHCAKLHSECNCSKEKRLAQL